MHKLIAGLLTLSLAAPAHAEYYRLNLTRVGENLYRESSTNIVIVTRNCHAYLYMEDVILNFSEPGAFDNMIVLNAEGDYCEVKEVRDAVS